MKLYNVEFNVKNLPKYDPDFKPMGAFVKAFLKKQQALYVSDLRKALL